MKKNIFVIIVTYNGGAWLRKNLSQLRQSDCAVKWIVVDNASSDNSVAIAQSFSDGHIILNQSNLGFGKANNIGIQAALDKGADYVFLLNQDAWVFPETIGNLLDVAENHPQCGILSPVHLAGDGTSLDENFSTYWTRKIGPISESIDQVPFVNAAAWLMPRSAVMRVGYFEPLFGHYGEDRNYVDRMRFHQYKIAVVKHSKICHDRTIKRLFAKDMVQSKYLILRAVLNINQSFLCAYFSGFKLVFGLPKYFRKNYDWRKLFWLFFMLKIYYLKLILKSFIIFKKRNDYKQ